MRTFIITLALFSVTPSIAYDGSKNEIETEILNHAVIPCATLASLVGIQEVSDYRPDLTAKQHGEISLHSLVESISNAYPVVAKDMERRVYLKVYRELRRERMKIYQLTVASCVSGALYGTTRMDRVHTLMSDEFLSQLAATGWDEPPYRMNR